MLRICFAPLMSCISSEHGQQFPEHLQTVINFFHGGLLTETEPQRGLQQILLQMNLLQHRAHRKFLVG